MRKRRGRAIDYLSCSLRRPPAVYSNLVEPIAVRFAVGPGSRVLSASESGAVMQMDAASQSQCGATDRT